MINFKVDAGEVSCSILTNLGKLDVTFWQEKNPAGICIVLFRRLWLFDKGEPVVGIAMERQTFETNARRRNSKSLLKFARLFSAEELATISEKDLRNIELHRKILFS